MEANLGIKKVYVLDCETHGITNNPNTERPDIIELAYIGLSQHYADLYNLANQPKVDLVTSTLEQAKTGYSERFRPEMSIHPDAFKIHGIRFIDVLKCRKHTEALGEVPNMDYLVAHNATFDYRCIGKPEGVKLICTMKLSKKLAKFNGIKIPNHQLDTLVSHYYPEFPELIGKTHTALGDCVKAILVFVRLIEQLPGIKTWEELHQFLEKKV